jgi:RNA polymerase-binding transcription factor DksA
MSDLESDPGTAAVTSHEEHGALDERVEAVLLREELDDVEHALSRLDDGTYGTCHVCGQTLDDDRLAQMPQARCCVEHQS